MKTMHSARLLLFLFFIPTSSIAQQMVPPLPVAERPLKLPKISEKRLANGLLVIVASLPTIPKVSAILSFHTGDSTWREHHAGAPAIAAEVLKEGTSTRSSMQIQEALGSMGATLSTSVNEDSTELTGTTLSEFTDEYLHLLSDIVRNPSYPETEVELAKQNLIQRIRGQRALPWFPALEQLRKAIYGNHPYSFLIPDEKSIESLNSAVLRKFASAYYSPANTHLVLVGDIQESTAFGIAEKAFGNWKRSEVPKPETADLPNREKREIIFVHRPGSVQSNILVGIATFPRNDPDYVPMGTANTIYGLAFFSRLNQNIREKRGYSYSPFSGNFTMARLGSFIVSAQVGNEVTGASLLEIFYEMDRMRVLPVSQEELEAARAYQKGQFSIELASQSGLAGRINTTYRYGLPKDFIQKCRSYVNAVTVADVQRVAAKYFDTYRCAVVIVGDYEKVKEQVLPWGDVTVLDENGNKLKM